jgi:hypothetical protein
MKLSELFLIVLYCRPASESLWWFQYVMLDIVLFLLILPTVSALVLYKLASILILTRLRKTKAE